MKFHEKSYGRSGPPLIILHGLFGSLDNWATLAKEFALSFRVFTFDARNHGRSPHSSVINYEVMAEDLRSFMASHHLDSAHLLGHSMGGKTVMQFALTYPEHAARIMVVDVAPRSYPGKHDTILDALCALQLERYRERKEADEALEPSIPSAATRQFLLKNLARNDDGSFRWKMNLSALKRHYPEIAGNITATGKFLKPAMFIKGGLSRYIVEDDRAAIRGMFPKAIITTIKKAGHWVHSDAPEEMKELVFRFFG